jgi:AbrB family looped-hinge helix DNA binding protein
MEPTETAIPYVYGTVRNMQRGPRRKRNPGGATIARITSKGQMTVPKNVREFMGLEPGDAVLISMLGEQVTMERIVPLDELERVPVPEEVRTMSDEDRQRLIDERRRRQWEAKVRRESPDWRPEDEEPA